MITGHVPPRTDGAVAEVRLTASSGVPPSKALRALWSGVLVDPRKGPTNLAIEEDILVDENLQVTANSVIFKVQLDCSIRSFVSSRGDNPYRAIDDLKFRKKTLMKDLVSKLSFHNFLVVRVKTGNRGPFNAGDSRPFYEDRFSIICNVEELSARKVRHGPEIIVNGTLEDDMQHFPVK